MENLKKKERKQKLLAEAEKLGISYKELKAQKKEAKASKRSREADILDSSEHKQDVKRMRAWSHDEKENGEDSKRRRTRSMDAKEEEVAKSSTDMTPEEWRKDVGITIRGHGKYTGLASSEFAKPFFKFSDAPFSQAVLRTFDALGYKSPTAIQAQVCNCPVEYVITNNKQQFIFLMAFLFLIRHGPLLLKEMI